MRARLAESLTGFASVAAEFLRGIGRAFAERQSPPSLDGFNAATASLLADIEAVKGDERLVALSFALEQLQRNLKDLTRRAQEFARVREPSLEESEP